MGQEGGKSEGFGPNIRGRFSQSVKAGLINQAGERLLMKRHIDVF
jgi:hypothetical protein